MATAANGRFTGRRHRVVGAASAVPRAARAAGRAAFLTTYGASHANGRAAAEALGLAAKAT